MVYANRVKKANEQWLTMRAHMPLRRSAASSRRASPQSRSMAPDSKIGSFDGENSSSRLHKVDDATARMSSSAFRRSLISGFHTEWSWTPYISFDSFDFTGSPSFDVVIYHKYVLS